MIPYFQIQSFSIGPLQIQMWGLMVALGVILSLWIGRRRATKQGLDGAEFLDMSAWALLAGIIGARLLYVLAYEPWMIINDPLSVVRIWDGGMSAIGGFIGAGLAFWVYCYRNRLSFLDYANVTAFALPWGYAVGRIGCFFIHDHIGIATKSFLAVNFGVGPRLDMGLIHVLFGLVIGITFLILDRKYGKQIPYFLLFLLIYGLGRMGLDFFRDWGMIQAERRYFSLTPAQYISLPVIIVSVWYLIHPPKRRIWQRILNIFYKLKRR